MDWKINQIAEDMEYVTLSNGDICFVNGYMLENRKQNKFYPLTVYFKDIVSVVKYKK